LTRDFILGFISQFTFSIAYHILYPTLPIYLSRFGRTEVEIGILIGVLGASSLVFRPIVGSALVRIPEKRFMIGGAVLFVLTFIAYPFALPFWPLFIVRVFQGIGLAFFFTAALTFISNISPAAHRGQSVSYYLLAVNISLALSPSLGMFMINRFSFTFLFLFCLGLSLCSLLVTGKLGRRQDVPLEDRHTADGFLLSRKALPASISSFFFHLAWGALVAFFPIYAVNHGVANPGIFFTAVAVVLILGRALGGRMLDLYSRDKVILPCIIVGVISMALLAFSKTLPMFILAAVIWGMGHAFLFPSLLVYATEGIGASRGPAMGTFSGLSDLGMSLGPMVMGVVIHLTDYRTMFLCLALVGMINLAYFYFLVRRKTALSS
jgi:MFS family permease